MLHLDSTQQLPDLKPQQPGMTSSTELKSDTKKKNKLVVVDTYKKLNFEKFLYTDMNKFDAKVVAVEDNVFTPSEFIVEIRISNIPPLQIGKTYEEFRAFYKALKLRFPNIKWPDFPPHFQLVKKVETRKAVFNQILEEICACAKLQDTFKKSLLGLFFAFFLDKSVAAKIKCLPPPPETLDNSKNHDENNSDRPFGDSILGHSEDFDAGTSKDNSTIAEESIDRSASFVIDSNRKYSFMSTPRGDGKRDRCHSFENFYSMPNLDCSTPPDKNNLMEESKAEQIVWSYDNKNNAEFHASPSGKREDEFRKMSIDEDGILEKERIREQQQHIQQPIEGVVSKNASILKPTINIIETPAASQQNIPEDKKNRSRANSNMQPSPKNSPLLGVQQPHTDYPLNNSVLAPEVHEGPRNSVSVRKGSSSMDIEKYLTREFPKFSGDIYIQISSEKSWNKYFGKIQNSCLLLYPTILDNFPLHFIPCFRAVVKHVHTHHGDYIELYHHYDADKLRICIDPNAKDQDDLLVAEKNLRVWEAQLRMASEKITDLELTDNYYFYAVGKLQLVGKSFLSDILLSKIVCDASDIKLLPSRSSCYLRIKHKPYVLQTSKSLSGENMKWKQSFFIPISDVFFPITLELVCSYNDGWITESLKEEVICTLEIPVQDLLSLPSNEILQVNLPFKYTDQRKAKIMKTLGVNEETLNTPNIRLKFNNLSSVKSYFAPPYGDYVEGVKMDTDTFTKQGLKLSLARIRRIISYIILFFRDIRNLFHFKYPFFSYVCTLLIICFIAFFDVSESMAFFWILMAFLCIYNNPRVKARVKPVLDSVFFNQDHLNPFFREPQIQTLSDLEMAETFNTERWKYKLTDDESIYSVMKRAKKSVVGLTILFHKISGFFEKMKNIIMWQDSRRSMIFLICTLIGYCIFALVPLRLIIFIAITAKLIKGINYFKNLRQKNRQVAINTINFILNKQFHELAKFVANSPNEPWNTTPSILKKLAQQLKYRLDLDLPEDALIQTFKTPEELIRAIESCRVHLKFKQDASEASAEMMQRKDPKFKIDNLFYFIMNIPSDYYRVIQPKIISRESKKDV